MRRLRLPEDQINQSKPKIRVKDIVKNLRLTTFKSGHCQKEFDKLKKIIN